MTCTGPEDANTTIIAHVRGKERVGAKEEKEEEKRRSNPIKKVRRASFWSQKQHDSSTSNVPYDSSLCLITMTHHSSTFNVRYAQTCMHALTVVRRANRSRAQHGRYAPTTLTFQVRESMRQRSNAGTKHLRNVMTSAIWCTSA